VQKIITNKYRLLPLLYKYYRKFKVNNQVKLAFDDDIVLYWLLSINYYYNRSILQIYRCKVSINRSKHNG